ncbi:MAG: DegT/DnrJ/EryC1/StrS family aminotransferase [Candidatus Pacebacteria bacterium]|nr:DegT/DnrJ/EryC1/StrS family aminotransferase [Candidatus Paceibacterota bacterium]
MFIPVNEPKLSIEAKKYAHDAIDSGWISSSGKYVTQFEDDFARLYGVRHAIAVSNGTAALHVALLALHIGQGDEVIVPAFTMAASWLAVLYTGATPVFVDCDATTYNIDVHRIEAKISSKTRAIMPVHIYGQPCEMDEIRALAKRHNVAIIEDAAEAHGALYRGRLAGTLGDVGCFSFYGNKIITTGEGGMIITNDDSIAAQCRKIKDLHHSSTRFIHDGVGYNYRMTNMQAALGCGELAHLQEYIEKKRWMAQLYKRHLQGIAGIQLPREVEHAHSVYWMYAIVIDEHKFGMNKQQLRAGLKDVGIDTRDFFYPPEQQPVLRKILGGEVFPVAADLAHRGLYLPSGLALTEAQLLYVCKSIELLHRRNTACPID